MRSSIRAHGGAVATLPLITAVGCGGRSDTKTHGGFTGAGVVTQPRYPTPHRPQRHRVPVVLGHAVDAIAQVVEGHPGPGREDAVGDFGASHFEAVHERGGAGGGVRRRDAESQRTLAHGRTRGHHDHLPGHQKPYLNRTCSLDFCWSGMVSLGVREACRRLVSA